MRRTVGDRRADNVAMAQRIAAMIQKLRDEGKYLPERGGYWTSAPTVLKPKRKDDSISA